MTRMIEPLLVPRESFDDPDAAVDRVRLIYQTGVDHLRRHLHDFVAGRPPAEGMDHVLHHLSTRQCRSARRRAARTHRRHPFHPQ